jgi:hypothetical protein
LLSACGNNGLSDAPATLVVPTVSLVAEDLPKPEEVLEEALEEAVSPSETPGAFVVFMGETITAPGSYPNVPDLYVPVLDDIYLYTTLSQRYSALQYDGEATAEILRVKQMLQRAIQERGNLPRPGSLGSTTGYALVDLNGDNDSILLILDNPPGIALHNLTPLIYAVYAIRNGQLVCIDPGSYIWSSNTKLASDGTFYQYWWRGAGYVDLKAFRLDAGMSAFTVISEAYASLSFADGDVPVPFWVKIENGNEIHITEDEFDALYQKYKNPNELMVLDFVPLHPNWVNPWSVPRPSDNIDNTPHVPVDFPEAYPGAPCAYKPILDDLFLFEKHLMSEGYPFDGYFLPEGFVEYPYIKDNLGYALVDINNDGALTLLLGTIYGLNNAAPHAIYTLINGEPVLVAQFWSRFRGVIAQDGTIYSVRSGGAAYTYLSSYRLYENASALTQLTEIKSDYSASEGKPYYIQVINGRNHYISEEEFMGFWEMYRNPSDRMKLTVMPIDF